LRPGDRLPSVQALAAQVGVAPPTLREALRRLQATGVVEIRHGSGVYVRRATPRLVLAGYTPTKLEDKVLLDLLEARLLIEPRLARLAAERSTPADLDALDVLLSESAKFLDGPYDKLDDLNLRFHRGIANSAGNAVLAEVIDALLDVYAMEQLEIQFLYDDRGADHRQHLSILAAIRAGRAEDAGTLMHQHLQGVIGAVSARLARQARKPGEIPHGR